MTFCPAQVGYGLKFVRVDLQPEVEIPALLENVTDLLRGTTISIGDVHVHTVEHVLSALAGLQVDNCRIELTASEPPVMDGSAMPFVELLQTLGFEDQGVPKQYFSPAEHIQYRDPTGFIDLIVMPSDRFRVTYMIDYTHPGIGTQYTSLYDIEDEFVQEYAAARTFCLLSELDLLQKSDLIQGGVLGAAVVFIDKKLSASAISDLREQYNLADDVQINEQGIVSLGEIRWPNEPVRHKVVDLIGDLALLGVPLKGHVLCARAGHKSHIEIVRLLDKELKRTQLQRKYQTENAGNYVFDIDAIQRILPHRYPMLLVDRILTMIPGKEVVGVKNVTFNEPHFTGHFPDKPIMPGVLVVEAMGQVGGILLLNSVDKPEDHLVYFTGLDEVKFRKLVRPGDQLVMKVSTIQARRNIWKMKGEAFVDGQLAAEAVMQAVLVKKQQG